MGFLGRTLRFFRRFIGRATPTAPPVEPIDTPPGGPGPTGDDLGVSGPVDNWYIAATWDGPGTKRRYSDPDDLKRLGPGGQVIIAYQDPDTHLVTYRTIHGPFRGDEDDIWEQVRFTTLQVSPP